MAHIPFNAPGLPPLFPQPSHGAPTPAAPEVTHVNSLGAAAAKYGIPVYWLYGVWGMETDFGKNVATSSAGAMGNFQFIPGTARQYGYPMTNTPTQAEFDKQVDAAAHYLSDLHRQYGSWNSVLLHYSGNGYGADKVRAKLQDNPGIFSGRGGDIPGPGLIGGIAAGPLGDVIATPAEVAKKALDLITSLQFWLRIGEGIAGLILIAMGLKALTGVTVPIPTPAGPVRV